MNKEVMTALKKKQQERKSKSQRTHHHNDKDYDDHDGSCYGNVDNVVVGIIVVIATFVTTFFRVRYVIVVISIWVVGHLQ